MSEKTFEEVLAEECDDDAYEHAMDDRAEDKRKLAQEASLDTFVEEKRLVSKSMRTYGDNKFVTALGIAIRYANLQEGQQIKSGFHLLWREHHLNGKKEDL